MDKELAKKYIEATEAGKRSWLGVWDKVYRYVLPERAQLYVQDGNPPSYDKVFDATAINAAERLTNLIISGLCPPWQQWFRLVPGSAIVRETDRTKIRKETEQLEKRIFMHLNQSNFYQEFQPFILDRVVGGTSALGVTPSEDGRFQYQCIPLSEASFADDDHGNITVIVRRYKRPFFLLDRMYPKLSRGETADWYRTAKDAPNDDHELVLFSYNQVEKGWETHVYLGKGFHEVEKYPSAFPPIIGSRWSKVPGSPYGRGPALRAFSDIRAANRLKELVLKNAARTSLGIYTVQDDGVINPYTITLREGSMIPVNSNDTQSPSIAPLTVSGQFDVSMISLERLQSEIKSAFIADQFGPVDKTPMSATEIMERTRVIAQELGMTISRLEFEVLIPVLKQYLFYLSDGLPLDGEVLNVEFTSRLAQSQWAMDAQELSMYIQEISAYAQTGMDPKLAVLVDMAEAFRYKAELQGIPARLLRGQAAIQEELDRQQMQQPEEGGVV